MPRIASDQSDAIHLELVKNMLTCSIKMQMAAMARKKETAITFFVLLMFVLVNFWGNIKENAGIGYISQMYDYIKVLTLSDYSRTGYFLMEFFPLLAVMPTAYSYLVDRNTNIKTYIESRTGKRNYLYGKVISVFLITFLVFTIPFLIEVLMGGICFDIRSAGDPSNLGYFQTVEWDGRLFLSGIFFANKIVYAVLCIVLFGIVSGVLAVFNFAVSTLKFMKYKIYTFFPIYILLFVMDVVENVMHLEFTMSYMFILRMFNVVSKNYAFYCAVLIVLIFISILLLERKLKRNEID